MLIIESHLWWRAELRQVNTSRGTIAQSVITLLNLACKTLRGASTVALAEKFASFKGSARRLVKYYKINRSNRDTYRLFLRVQLLLLLHCNTLSTFLVDYGKNQTTLHVLLTRNIWSNKQSYHCGCHEEIPRQQRSQPQHEENPPHAIISVMRRDTGMRIFHWFRSVFWFIGFWSTRMKKVFLKSTLYKVLWGD